MDAEDEGDEGEAARRQIMQGAIVKSVMSSAAKGCFLRMLSCVFIAEFRFYSFAKDRALHFFAGLAGDVSMPRFAARYAFESPLHFVA